MMRALLPDHTIRQIAPHYPAFPHLGAASTGLPLVIPLPTVSSMLRKVGDRRQLSLHAERLGNGGHFRG